MSRHILWIFMLFTTLRALASDGGIIGKVDSVSGCAKSAMVWLSLDESEYKKRLLLMHTDVPVGGKFQFYLKPGQYQLRATDEKGCEFFSKIKVTNEVSSVTVRMKK